MRAWIIYIYIANNRIVKLDGKGYCKAKVKMGEVEMFFCRYRPQKCELVSPARIKSIFMIKFRVTHRIRVIV